MYYALDSQTWDAEFTASLLELNHITEAWELSLDCDDKHLCSLG